MRASTKDVHPDVSLVHMYQSNTGVTPRQLGMGTGNTFTNYATCEAVQYCMRQLHIERMCVTARPEHMLRQMHSWPCRKKGLVLAALRAPT